MPRRHLEVADLEAAYVAPREALASATKPRERRLSKQESANSDDAAVLAIRPFIKWAGGKTRLLTKLLPHVPKTFANYHEPFLGGGAMFFAVGAQAKKDCYLSDLNEDLINAWVAVRDHHDALEKALRRYRRRDSEEFFYSVRTQQPRTPITRAARFLYLNQTAWNGLWRVNRWGEFNVPWGQRPFRGFSSSSLENLRSRLSRARVDLMDFREALTLPRRGDFVYLDPPYLPLSETSKFFLYTEKRFREPDVRELAAMCRQLTKRGVTWLLSNRDTPLIRELFADAHIVGLTARRSVAAQNQRDVESIESPEVIVVGGSLRP